MNAYNNLMARIQSESMTFTDEEREQIQKNTKALITRVEAYSNKRCFCNKVKFNSLCKVCREA
jgi:hypothetical protein